MNLNEVAILLACSKKQVQETIEKGVPLPRSNIVIYLKAEKIRGSYEINEADLDEYIAKFETEAPSRHPPVAVCRELLVEAGHRCAICKDSAPVQFHHMIEFSKLNHHDPKHMLAVCGNCHSKINRGEIDRKSQDMYKEKLQHQSRVIAFNDKESSSFLIRFSWDDLRDIITDLHEIVVSGQSSSESKYDFRVVQIECKNNLNNMGIEYFEMMKDHHEPHFGKIERFLKNPINTEISNLYHEVVDELRSKIAANRNNFNTFEEILLQIRDQAGTQTELKGSQRILNTLLSFMYFSCDIGRKV